jgi:hypothetical protein
MSVPSAPFTREWKSPGTDTIIEFDFGFAPVFDADPVGAAAFTDWDGAALGGVTVTLQGIDSPVVQARVSGGTAGQTYRIKCKATSTADGFDEELFLQLWVRLPAADT